MSKGFNILATVLTILCAVITTSSLYLVLTMEKAEVEESDIVESNINPLFDNNFRYVFQESHCYEEEIEKYNRLSLRANGTSFVTYHRLSLCESMIDIDIERMRGDEVYGDAVMEAVSKRYEALIVINEEIENIKQQKRLQLSRKLGVAQSSIFNPIVINKGIEKDLEGEKI